MTPILRRSKESARRQRSRPESEKVQDIPHSRPLADRIRPNVHHDNPRKRPHDRIGNAGRGRGGHRYEHEIVQLISRKNSSMFLHFQG